MRILYRVTFTALIIISLIGCAPVPAYSDLIPSLTPTVIASSSPDYSFGKILYVVPGEITNVFMSNPDANESFLVLSDTGIRAVSLSPGANLVAYVIDETIYVKDINDGQIKQLNSQPISGFYNKMEWSPDSKSIGFDCLIGSVSEICVMDVENSLLKILTNSKNLGAQFFDGAIFGSWNEDGSQIVYCLKVSSPQGGIPGTSFMLLNILDGSSTQFLDEKNDIGITNYGCPVFRPRIQSILFTAKQNEKYMIFSANLNDSNIRRITDPSINYDIHEPIVVDPTGKYFFANAAKQDSKELIDVPTLFSAEGQIILQLELPSAKVIAWVNQ